MALMTPDPTFYPSARLAREAPPERLGYVAVLNTNGQPDAMSVVDLDPESPNYGTIVKEPLNNRHSSAGRNPQELCHDQVCIWRGFSGFRLSPE